jgi:hypothetical protein
MSGRTSGIAALLVCCAKRNPMPTRGRNARDIDVDNTPAVPEVWIPFSAAGKVARMQFRTNPAP